MKKNIVTALFILAIAFIVFFLPRTLIPHYQISTVNCDNIIYAVRINTITGQCEMADNITKDWRPFPPARSLTAQDVLGH